MKKALWTPVTLISAALLSLALFQPASSAAPLPRPKGPCDVYAAAHTPCVAAHSTTRALFADYRGSLYQLLRQSDGKTLNIGVVGPTATDPGGYADAAAQDRFCAHTVCWIATIYDQAGKGNDLKQAPRGAFSGPAMGGFNNLPLADMAPVSIAGHKVYGVFIAPGMGLRQNDAKGTAVDDQAQGQYWVINGHHYNSGCCFDYGNAEIDSRDDDNGTMETTYYGNSTGWFHGTAPGPWVMTDQENNLVGCANPDGSKFCASLPSISSRFVTAMAKGEPHHWTSLGGDAQRGALSVMFDGPRVDASYDPMRKQGAILLGNGGDNSNSSQGTFYEGAMTAAGTFPSDAADQAVQANVVAAHYDVAPVSVTPAAQVKAAPGLQTFAPNVPQKVTVTYTNTTAAVADHVRLRLVLPQGWNAAAEGPATSAGPVAPGASISTSFAVTAGPKAFNGNLVGHASWTKEGHKSEATGLEKARNGAAVKINEFRVSDGSANATNSFIELYNVGVSAVDLSNWTLTQHQTQQAVFSQIRLPAQTMLGPHAFYLLGLSTSGLVTTAQPGDTTVYLRSIAGFKAGDTIRIGMGSNAERRKIVSVGTAASPSTTVWQPVPDGPVITIPAGATNIPVTSTADIAVGQKIALGYGATYPAVGRGLERYEVATVTAVGKPGTQAYLAADAPAGASNIKVTSVGNISVGDRIRLDIASVGHGVETVEVKKIGTAATRTNLSANAAAGATTMRVRNAAGLSVGQNIIVGTPANHQAVTITGIDNASPAGAAYPPPPPTISFTPALAAAHVTAEWVMQPGIGLDLAAPLKFAHSNNLPFSARGTGIGFAPASKFPHASNEPVQVLGTGVTLDQPLAHVHAIDASVQDDTVTGAGTSAGYQHGPKPDQWFGGPALSASAGSMVLRDGAGMVVDSLNYGLLVDPWASEGYQATSGAREEGCRVGAPGSDGGFGAQAIVSNRSAGRFPDGADTDSNCGDFLLQPAAILPQGAEAGARTVKVSNVEGFETGQTVSIGQGAEQESARIASVGTGGASKIISAVQAGGTVLPVANTAGFRAGQTIIIGAGADQETALVNAVAGGRAGARIIIAAPLARAHAVATEVHGSGITLEKALSRAHAGGTQINAAVPTPGAPNTYFRP